MRRRLAVAMSFTAIFAAPALASSEDSWAEHDRAVRDACFKASAFKNPKVASMPLLFDDTIGYSALIVEGEYPQDHMKGITGQMLCLYNTRTQLAFVSEVMKPE